MAMAVGVGLTNDCNLGCEHCYRPTDRIYSLSLADIQDLCAALPIASIGLGTGENALHPHFLEIVAYIRDRGIKLSMASNGYSLNVMPEEYLTAFHDVEVSIDFPTEAKQDAFRGQGNWHDAHAAVARCRKAGLTVSLLATMMNVNFDKMGALARLAQTLGVNLRVNAYQPVLHGRFSLTYEQFWEGYRRLLGESKLLSCTEPVVRAVLGLGSTHSPCGRESLRVTPQRVVAPCVYWPDSTLTISDLSRLGVSILDTPEFQRVRQVPASAADCPCQGGCSSRRALLGNLDQHDMYCPWARNETVSLTCQAAITDDLVRSRHYCTTIVV